MGAAGHGPEMLLGADHTMGAMRLDVPAIGAASHHLMFKTPGCPSYSIGHVFVAHYSQRSMVTSPFGHSCQFVGLNAPPTPRLQGIAEKYMAISVVDDYVLQLLFLTYSAANVGLVVDRSAKLVP